MFVVIGHVDDDLLEEHFLPDGITASSARDSKLLIHSTATSIEEIAVETNIWPSKSQARKNNMFGDIPIGITKHGTKKKCIWIWRSPC